MSDLRQAAEMALEALKYHTMQTRPIDYTDKAIEALRQALEQDDHGFDRTASHMAGEYVDTAQQEPVARVNRDGFIVETGFGILEGTLLYTAPPKREWVGLTDKEVQSLADTYLDVGDGEGGKHYVFGDVDFARAIEAKLKEKNT